MSLLLERVYNPDILNCLANLSNDEVFTPPEVVNDMLDMLPQELFENPNTTFLDPACKTGVFLREIAKRLLKGLENVIPDEDERREHIFKNQLFGIAITGMTSLLSRRSLYCSKYANTRYSIVQFKDVEGNIRFKNMEHYWESNRCGFCGASKSQYDRDKELEQHAYEFIHTSKPEEIFNMRFDVIIGNPPYQLETEGAGKQAKPIYHLFVEQAKKLNPRYLSMIIPSRWFAGGMGLDRFRETMINDGHTTKIVDYVNAKDCFPENSISGGVCYFLWERDREADCEFTSIFNGKRSTSIRPLNEFNILVRYNEGVAVIHKVNNLNEKSLADIVSPLMPFGLSTNVRGNIRSSEKNDITLHASDGITYISRADLSKGIELIDKYKILVSKTSAEHAGEPSKDGTFRVLTSSIKPIGPKEVCTHSYFIIGQWDSSEYSKNALSYLKTKFVRFLILLSMTSINLSKMVFTFVPIQDFSKPWTDEELYAKYDLTDEEITFIESMIRPMD